MIRILLTGGKSGGHVYPLVSVIRALKEIAEEQDLEVEFVVISSGDGLGKEVFQKEGVRIRKLYIGKLRRYFSFKTILEMFLLPFSFLQALFLVWWEMPDVVIGNGGSVEVPVGIAGWLYRIPILIHESDAVSGMGNRILRLIASRVAVSFSEALKYFPEDKTALVGNPIRLSLASGKEEDAREKFDLETYRAGLLVLGGSQGAEEINDLVSAGASRLLDRVEVLHQCGPDHVERTRERIKRRLDKEERSAYHIKGFLDEEELASAYSWADLVVARAGAGLIFEIAALGIPSLLIPLSSAASDHQRKNAYAYSTKGACRVLEGGNLSVNMFTGEVKRIIDNPDARKKMHEAALEFSRPEAAGKIAEEALKLAQIEQK